MRVSFDSNAWEKVFAEGDQFYIAIRSALYEGRIRGFICETSFRIEAILNKSRSDFFATPRLSVSTEISGFEDGRPRLSISMGPDETVHPGLPPIQARKFERALVAGVKLLRGQSWMGLSGPKATNQPHLFVAEGKDAMLRRQTCQLKVGGEIEGRGLGYRAFEAAGGWSEQVIAHEKIKKFRRACAEWSDGELIAAHVGYGNDILCTDDKAGRGCPSVFDAVHRAWLTRDYGVKFMTLKELGNQVAVPRD